MSNSYRFSGDCGFKSYTLSDTTCGVNPELGIKSLCQPLFQIDYTSDSYAVQISSSRVSPEFTYIVAPNTPTHSHVISSPTCLQWIEGFCWQVLTYLLTTLLVFISYLPSLSTLSCVTARALCHFQHAINAHAPADTTLFTLLLHFVCVLSTGFLLLVWISPLILSPVSFSYSLCFSPKRLNLCESLRVCPLSGVDYQVAHGILSQLVPSSSWIRCEGNQLTENQMWSGLTPDFERCWHKVDQHRVNFNPTALVVWFFFFFTMTKR